MQWGGGGLVNRLKENLLARGRRAGTTPLVNRLKENLCAHMFVYRLKENLLANGLDPPTPSKMQIRHSNTHEGSEVRGEQCCQQIERESVDNALGMCPNVAGEGREGHPTHECNFLRVEKGALGKAMLDNLPQGKGR